MKIKFFTALAMLFSILFYSCQKEHSGFQDKEIINQFFNEDYILKKNTNISTQFRDKMQLFSTLRLEDDPLKIDVTDDMYLAESIQSYLSNFTNTVGFAVWSAALKLTDDPQYDEVIIIPTIKLNSTEINGVLFAKRNGNEIIYSLIPRGGINDKYGSDSDAKYMVIQSFSRFDKELFDKDIEDIDDLVSLVGGQLSVDEVVEIFGQTPLNSMPPPFSGGTGNGFWNAVLCDGETWCWQWVSFGFDDLHNEVEIAALGTTGGSSSSGGGTGAGNGGPGMVVTQEDVLQYQWDMAPTAIITDELADYPCAKDLADNLESIRDDLAMSMYQIFGTTETVDIIFYTDDSMPDNTHGTSVAQSGGPNYFKNMITLNPTYLNSTQDHILCTIIHEIIHGYIEYYKYKVDVQGTMTQAEFDEMFPIYAELGAGGIDDTEIQEHEEMAANYVNLIAGILMEHNPDLTLDTAVKRAWSGLLDTEVGNNLDPDYRNEAIDVIMAARTQNPDSSYNFINCNE